MVFKSELFVTLRANDVEVGTGADENTRQDQGTMGRIHSPGSANN